MNWRLDLSRVEDFGRQAAVVINRIFDLSTDRVLNREFYGAAYDGLTSTGEMIQNLKELGRIVQQIEAIRKRWSENLKEAEVTSRLSLPVGPISASLLPLSLASFGLSYYFDPNYINLSVVLLDLGFVSSAMDVLAFVLESSSENARLKIPRRLLSPSSWFRSTSASKPLRVESAFLKSLRAFLDPHLKQKFQGLRTPGGVFDLVRSQARCAGILAEIHGSFSGLSERILDPGMERLQALGGAEGLLGHTSPSPSSEGVR